MQDSTELISNLVSESLQVKARFFQENRERLAEAAALIAQTFRRNGKLLLFGNGGSAADAQHLAAEFVGRFIPDRPPLPAIALSTDTSLLTACANDYGFSSVFARQVTALAAAGDCAIAISTSGNSENVLNACVAAHDKGVYVIGFTGETGGRLADCVDLIFCVPSRSTPRIQETHIMLGHILCELVDRAVFPNAYPRD